MRLHRSTLVTAALTGTLAALLITLTVRPALAHCEIPCGIYDDHMRIDQMFEDTTTIAKAVAQITQLAGRHDPEAAQQAIRWTMKTKQTVNPRAVEELRMAIEVIAPYYPAQHTHPATQPGHGGR